MTKPYYKPPTPINQAEIIPLSERTKLYQEINKGLLDLEKLYQGGPALIKRYIDACIEDEQKNKENKSAEIISFTGGAL
jgi:hypothetical protein